MTAVESGPGKGRSRWWTGLLALSIGLNLVAGGLIAARFAWPDRVERMAGIGYTQLLPRRFMHDLPSGRRHELFDIVKSYRDRFRQGRDAMSAASMALAEALRADPYDPAKVKPAVDNFASAGNGMIATGTAAAQDLIAKLTPDERRLLAQRLAEMSQRRR